ncbi:MAG: UvrD-helicase domain-containing protein, partial [Clostridia bacterium]|nr:UvrD-helicase domain-containing protein [Clostridia bacterium]
MSTLNKEQLEAVNTINGPVLILAGAGSGKTTVLINRIANMIDNGIAPWNILAITFTNKAAKEIKDRLSNTLGTDGDGVWASTFHSLGMRILMRDGGHIGIGSGFTIYDTADQKTLVKEVLKELNFSDKLFPVNSVINHISGAKDKLIGPDEYAKNAEISGNFHAVQLSKIYKLYQSKLRKNNAVDFDDLIVETVHLLESAPEVLEYYQRKFLYIMVDEYQDTSHSQYRLVSLLADRHKNICVVGDDDQSIYKFRGADITNILEFEKQFGGAKVIKLEQNYRSTTQILDIANEVIKNNKERKQKKLWSSNTCGTKVSLITVEHQHIEAHKIADLAEKLKANGKNYGDMAVLFRTNAQSRVLEEVFMQRGLPYRLLSGIKFYDRKEIKDIVAYLRIINNSLDDVSLKRVINEPKRGIGATTIDKLSACAARENTSILNVISNIDSFSELRSSAEKLTKFGVMIKNFKDAQDSISVLELVEKVLAASGYMEALRHEKTVEAETRIENLKEFMGLVKEFEANTVSGTLSEFLDGISLVSDIDNYDET